MSDELLRYYQEELAFIRGGAQDFARAHPEVAKRLRIGAAGADIDDPHVERLIEAFALLTGRVQRKLDDEFPELTDALLSVLYPHALAPVPSLAVVQFGLDSGHGGAFRLPRSTEVESEPVNSVRCRFRTTQDVTLWPIEVESARLGPLELNLPGYSAPPHAAAMLRIGLRTAAPDMTFAKLAAASRKVPDGAPAGLGELRFFLHGDRPTTQLLYELLLNEAEHVVVVAGNDRSSASGERPTQTAPFRVQSPGTIRAAGFDESEAALPWPDRSFPGYRLMAEYFAFPEKFLFVDFTMLDDAIAQLASGGTWDGSRLELYVILKRAEPALEHHVSARTLRLACSPIINLFSQTAESIRLTHTDVSYRVVPDERQERLQSLEVYSIDSVAASRAAGSSTTGRVEYRPFFDPCHTGNEAEESRFWYASRVAAGSAAGPAVGGAVSNGRSRNGEDQASPSGTAMRITFVDLGDDLQFSDQNSETTVVVETTCLNRDLPQHLPFGGGRPRLRLVEGGAPIPRLEMLTPPTPTRRPTLAGAGALGGRGSMWRLVSHLNLNHLSIVNARRAEAGAGGAAGADALRRILQLYDVVDEPHTRAKIASLAAIESRRAVFAVRDGSASRGGFCRGLEVTIDFDESRFSDHGLFLFASILERFLGLYCSINSAFQMVARAGSPLRNVRRWDPRAGERVLL